jgi:predicted unusual protein kinase regulating ubiquinone biosynthesis (AarF/ABC1/UbiB family)
LAIAGASPGSSPAATGGSVAAASDLPSNRASNRSSDPAAHTAPRTVADPAAANSRDPAAAARDEVPIYDPAADLRWLLLRPWLLIGRLIQVISQLGWLGLGLAIQGNSRDSKVQKRLARRILATLADLGPCFIKVGQALSTRPDLVPRDWLDELTRLQDDLPAFPQAVALRLIASELGAPASELFVEFPDYPVAAASLGQVYRARLADGRWVAVKVQRPDLPFVLRRDLTIIRLLSRMAGPLLPLNLGFGLDEIIDEFGRSLFEEIDYRREAENAEHFARLFANNPEVTVPRVERRLTSRRVLTTQWIHGVKMQGRRELEAHHLDPAALIRTCVIAGLRQLLEFGYFHADPHPGNLFALPGRTGAMGHMAYVDFGMMDSLSDSDRLTLTGAVVHLINRDFKALARDFVRLGFLHPSTDLTPIIPALEEVLGNALGANVGSFNFKSITDRFSELMFDYPFRVPARFALIIRAVVSQEGLAIRLDPGFKILSVAYPYVARRLLAGDSAEMREKLMEVIFDPNGRLRVERLENLLAVVQEDGPSADLLPVARDGLRLLLGDQGGSLRQRLLLSLVAENRLHTDDLGALLRLLGQRFSMRKLAGSVLTRLNPLAA